MMSSGSKMNGSRPVQTLSLNPCCLRFQTHLTPMVRLRQKIRFSAYWPHSPSCQPLLHLQPARYQDLPQRGNSTHQRRLQARLRPGSQAQAGPFTVQNPINGLVSLPHQRSPPRNLSPHRLQQDDIRFRLRLVKQRASSDQCSLSSTNLARPQVTVLVIIVVMGKKVETDLYHHCWCPLVHLL